MHGQMPGEASEALGKIEQQFCLGKSAERGGEPLQLGVVLQGAAQIASIEPPELLRNEVNVLIADTEGSARIAGGPTCPIPRLHAEERHAGISIPAENRTVDLVPSSGFDVEINIGERGALPAQKAFEEQIVFERIDR